VPGGKSKMKEASGGAANCQGQPQQQGPNGVQMITVTCTSMPMSTFAEQLGRGVLGYQLGAVADKTGLTASYDFQLQVTPRPMLPLAGADGISLFDAMEQQLGVKLEQQQVSSSATIVESVNRTPTANPPGVAAAIPTPPPPEFEVATLK